MNDTPTNNFEKNNLQQLNQTAQKASNALATQNGAQRFEEAYSKCGGPMAKCFSMPEQQNQSNNVKEQLNQHILSELRHFPSNAGKVVEKRGEIGINPNLQNFDVVHVDEHGNRTQSVNPNDFFILNDNTTQSISIQHMKEKHIGGREFVDIIVTNANGSKDQLLFSSK